MSNINIANKRVAKDEVLYHIGLSEEMIDSAEIAILPGDPKRSEPLAKMLDKNAKFLATNREYTSYLAKVADRNTIVISTGMGGPSTAICIEELAMIGIKKLIRVGTCGAIQENIDFGDLILTTASVRLDGTSYHYAPIEYPAVADFKLNSSLYNSAKSLNIDIHCGITGSSDTFYPGQERRDSYSGYVRKHFRESLDEWRKLNVLNLEMESSALLTVCATFGLQASCICTVIAKRTTSESVNKSRYDKGMQNIMSIIKHSIENNFEN
ncbi:uridine phosphorylase [Francisella orientalis]|uniref:Uridine phosphorylase n=1 Tax=Francisella orientalis TaxID=299583 RepID=A0AAP6XAN6_9GAMM|nr:uridine phosphorylase [Francisella orientalis]AFJ43661.1 uridine phosphorylase [Francisella orientalis str. Toba 04]AHB98221.1 uridine phosphorylase [Francisella orientalis LADL 07-285A]AKN85364.1 Uridine phosphorylase [Francisella orientalis FNO12]AKN86903.1 Uridine phosphorylase [Francisella orientalis FNO24]AKN88441.1 Uridine phosphorylase [Francisella orientalis]